MRKALFFLFILTSFYSSKAQLYREGGVGIEGVYNIPIEGIGVALRYQYHLNDVFVIVPKVDYYLPMNKVHELQAGFDAQLRIQSWRTWGFYLIAGPYYDHWFNYEDSPHPNAKASNITAEAGVGFTTNYGCIRPYTEYRVNFKWIESNVRLGVAFYFQQCRKPSSCPPFYGMKKLKKAK